MILYKYGMRLRGFSIGCQPSGCRRREDGDEKYWDYIYYDRELGDKERADYELDFIGVAEDGI